MKLIYAQGACSFSVHVLLEEIGHRYEAIAVDLKDKTELEKYNEYGYVPVLILPSGEKITEAIAILQFLAEHYGRSDLFPEVGTLERARCVEWLAYLSSELHKTFKPLFHPENFSEKFISELRSMLDLRFSRLEEALESHKFLLGAQMSIADMYCLAILRIAEHLGLKFNKFPGIMTYRLMLEEMPLIQKVTSNEERAASLKKAA